MRSANLQKSLNLRSNRKAVTIPMPYGIEHDMSAFQGSSIIAIYVQTVASYIFKHILLKCTKHSANKNVQDYSTYTRCDYD